MLPPRRHEARRQLTVNDIPTGDFVPITATKLSVPKISDTRAIDLGAAFSKFLVAPSPEHVQQLHHSLAEDLARGWTPACVDTADDFISDLLLKQLSRQVHDGSSSSSSPSHHHHHQHGRRGGAAAASSAAAGRRNPTRQHISARATDELFLTLQAFYKLSHEASLRVHDELAVNTGVNIAEFYLLEQGYARSFGKMFPQFRKLPTLGVFLLRLLVTEGSVLSTALAPRVLPSLAAMRRDAALAAGILTPGAAAAAEEDNSNNNNNNNAPASGHQDPVAAAAAAAAKPSVSLLDQRRKEIVMQRLKSHVQQKEQEEQHAKAEREAMEKIEHSHGGAAGGNAAAIRRAKQQWQQAHAQTGEAAEKRAAAAAERAAFEETMEAQVSADWDRALMARSKEQFARWSGCIASLIATVQKALPDQEGLGSNFDNNMSGFFSPQSTTSGGGGGLGRRSSNVGLGGANSSSTPGSPLSASAAAAAQMQQQRDALHLVHTLDFPSGTVAREAFEQTCANLQIGAKVLLPPLMRFQQREAKFPTPAEKLAAASGGGRGGPGSPTFGGSRAASPFGASTTSSLSGATQQQQQQQQQRSASAVAPQRGLSQSSSGANANKSSGPGSMRRMRRESTASAAALGALPDVDLPRIPRKDEVIAASGGGKEDVNAALAAAVAAVAAVAGSSSTTMAPSATRGGKDKQQQNQQQSRSSSAPARPTTATATSSSSSGGGGRRGDHHHGPALPNLQSLAPPSATTNPNCTKPEEAKLAPHFFDYDATDAGKHINLYVETSKNHAFSLKPFLQDLRSAKARKAVKTVATRGGADISAAYHLLQKFAGSAAKRQRRVGSLGGIGSLGSSASIRIGPTVGSVEELERAADGAPLRRKPSGTSGFGAAQQLQQQQQQEDEEEEEEEEEFEEEEEEEDDAVGSDADEAEHRNPIQREEARRKRREERAAARKEARRKRKEESKKTAAAAALDHHDFGTAAASAAATATEATSASPADPFADIEMIEEGSDDGVEEMEEVEEQQHEEDEDEERGGSEQLSQSEPHQLDSSLDVTLEDAAGSVAAANATPTSARSSNSNSSQQSGGRPAKPLKRKLDRIDEAREQVKEAVRARVTFAVAEEETPKKKLQQERPRVKFGDFSKQQEDDDAHGEDDDDEFSDDDDDLSSFEDEEEPQPFDSGDGDLSDNDDHVPKPPALVRRARRGGANSNISGRRVPRLSPVQLGQHSSPVESPTPSPIQLPEAVAADANEQQQEPQTPEQKAQQQQQQQQQDVYLLRPFIVAEYLGFDVATNRINFRIVNDARPRRNVEFFAEEVTESLGGAEEHAELMFSRLAGRFLRAHRCPRHRSLSLSHYCANCDSFLCESCVLENHPGHEVVPRSAYCTQKIAALEPMRKMFLQRIELLKSLQGQVAESEQRLLSSVDGALAECRAGLNARRNALRSDALTRAKDMSLMVAAERERNGADREKLQRALYIVQEQQRRGILRFAPFVELHVPHQIRNELDLLLPSRVVQTVIQSLDWSLAAKHLTRVVYPSPEEVAAEEQRARRNQMLAVSAEKKTQMLLEKKNREAMQQKQKQLQRAGVSGGTSAASAAAAAAEDDEEDNAQKAMIDLAAAMNKKLTMLMNRRRLPIDTSLDAELPPKGVVVVSTEPSLLSPTKSREAFGSGGGGADFDKWHDESSL